MTDNRTMTEMLRAPTEGCAEAIVVPPILAEQFDLKHSLINMMTSEQLFGLEKDNPHDTFVGAARRWLEKEPPRSITTWDDLQTSAVTTAMTAMLKQLQANPPPAQVKAVEEIYVTCGGAHPYYQCLATGGNTFLEFRDNIQGYVSVAAGNYNQEEDECVEETYTDPNLAEYTIKVPPPPQEKDDIQIQKFWNMFKQLHLNITLAEALVLIPKYQKMLKALLSNKEKLQELANTPLNENCSAVILEKLPEKLGDPGKFLIPCGFSKLKYKALADLGASINMMPLSVWKKLGLPDFIPTRMTLELANHEIYTPDGIARDVFVPVGKFTFPADFVVVNYESDPRDPLILGRPFLRTARALIDVYGEEMILRDGDERLTLNMKHDKASYSDHPHRESVNLINIFNISSEDCLEVSVSNKQSDNPTFSLHKEIASPKVTHEFHDSKGCNFLSEELSDINSFNDIHPHFDDDPLSGSTTYSSNSLLEEFTDELALITYPPDYDDNLKYDIDSDLREIEFLLYQGEDFDLKDLIDKTDLASLDDLFVDPTLEMFTDEQPPDYTFPSRFDVYDDDFLEIESDADNFDNDSFDFKGEKIKKDDDLPLPNNEDKVFNPGILIYEKSVTIITRVAQEKKLAISYASLVFEDFDPPLYEPLVFKNVPNSMRLLPFSSENEEKVFKPGIYTSEKKEYSSLGCSSVPFLSPLIHSTTHEIHDSEGCNFLSAKLPDIDSINDIHPHFDDNPLSGSTTYSSNLLLEEFIDELALITYPPDYDDNLKCD
nr:reverse transcriptase domain-containing protein [Tanacetum cinerariifolium]